MVTILLTIYQLFSKSVYSIAVKVDEKVGKEKVIHSSNRAHSLCYAQQIISTIIRLLYYTHEPLKTDAGLLTCSEAFSQYREI